MTNQVGSISCCAIDFWLWRRIRLAAKAIALGGCQVAAVRLPIVKAAAAGL